MTDTDKIHSSSSHLLIFSKLFLSFARRYEERNISILIWQKHACFLTCAINKHSLHPQLVAVMHNQTVSQPYDVVRCHLFGKTIGNEYCMCLSGFEQASCNLVMAAISLVNRTVCPPDVFPTFANWCTFSFPVKNHSIAVSLFSFYT